MPSNADKSPVTNTLVLPGNTTKSDLIECIKLASSILKTPDDYPAAIKHGCYVALDGFAKGIK